MYKTVEANFKVSVATGVIVDSPLSIYDILVFEYFVRIHLAMFMRIKLQNMTTS